MLCVAPCVSSARTLLEISSGTGQHIAHFASVFTSPSATFQPSDMSEAGFASIVYHTRQQGERVRPPIVIDVVRQEEAERNLTQSGTPRTHYGEAAVLQDEDQ